MITDQEFTESKQDQETLYRAELQRPPGTSYLDPLGHARWDTDYYTLRERDRFPHLAALREVRRRIRAVAGLPDPELPTPPPPSDINLIGYLRPGPNASWADDSGPRSVRFCSYFPLVRIVHDNFDFARQQMDRMIGRYQGARIFWHLATSYWVSSGCAIDPRASWFESAFRRTLDELWQRGLRAQLTSGDLQLLPEKPRWFRRVAEQCRDYNQQVVALSEMVNEARVNSDEREDWAYWATRLLEWQSIYPWGMSGLSDPGEFEEPAALNAASRSPATCGLSHGTRQSPEDSIRRAYNLRYEGFRDLPICEGEPNGIDTGASPGVTDGTTSKPHIFGLYAAKILTGQMLTHFDSAGLGWHHYPLDREWGFKELPALWKAMGIPEDIGRYSCIPGHKAEAPMTVRRFADAGDGPARFDNVVSPDGSKGFVIGSGGSGTWEPVVRQDCNWQYWQHDGAFLDGQAAAGAGLAGIDSARQAVVVAWHR